MLIMVKEQCRRSEILTMKRAAGQEGNGWEEESILLSQV
jgi:hypothetical protein